MADVREKMTQQRRWFEKVLLWIPGFRGYLQKEYRRDADHILRQFLAQQVQEGKKHVQQAVRAVTDNGKIMLLKSVDQVNNLMEKIENRIKFAAHGYSGVFDAVKVKEAELDQLYEFDARLLDVLGELNAQLQALPAAAAGDPAAFTAAVQDVLERLRGVDTLLNNRENAIKGLVDAGA
ncbi:MAG: hypothetical protein KA419_18125 [Acidobacteria bacterium]|nr:hypothetical protein [Acidobacteriota bacterium]